MDARKRIYYPVDGTAAKKIKIKEHQDLHKRPPKNSQRKKKPTNVFIPSVNQKLDFKSTVLLLVTIAIAIVLCMDYLKVQGNIIQLRRDIVNLECEYNAAYEQNTILEENLTEITDLEELYKTAIIDYQMVYPNKNETILYQLDDKCGYVIQYENIPPLE